MDAACPITDRGHIRADVLHRIVNGQSRSHDAAGRVDVHRDVLFRVLRFKEQQLADTSEATASSTPPTMKMMRSFKSREKMS